MDLDKLPPRGDGGAIHVVVESPRGSTQKLKWLPAPGVFQAQRPLPLGFSYPYDWGFVPGTQAEDGDPVDALVVWDASSWPGVVVPSRPIGLLQLEQNARRGDTSQRIRNDRLLVVPVKDPRGAWVRSFEDLPARSREEIALFFTSAVFFEGKDPKILGWAGPDAGDALVERWRKR
ncbi:MAG TPA: inorganic diphosphatase [Anaeromyxobacteraceae bacterium]|nr:inorganic diphosphatase [Anaeromyxobacteraceae bacterium]